MLAGLLEEGMTLLGMQESFVVEKINLLDNTISVTLLGFNSRYVLEFALDEIVEVVSTEFEERFSREAKRRKA